MHVGALRYARRGRRGGSGIGTNKRYAHRYDMLMNERVLEGIARDDALQTLTTTELQLGIVPLTVDPKPHRRVKAWVRFGAVPVRVDAVVLRWTPDAVGIQFEIGAASHRCWVWSGAVEEVRAES